MVGAIAFAALGQAFLAAVPMLDSWQMLASWEDAPERLTWHFIHYGRFGQAAMFRLFHLLGYDTVAVAFSAQIISIALLVATSFLLMEAIVAGPKPAIAMAAACTLFVIQPNSAEIFTFPDVTLGVQLAFFLGAAGLLLSFRKTPPATAAAAFLIFTSLSLYQLSANYVAAAICLRFAYRAATGDELKSTVRAAIVFAVTMAIFLIAMKVTQGLADVPPTGRGVMIGLSDLPAFAENVAIAIQKAFLPYWINPATLYAAVAVAFFGAFALLAHGMRHAGVGRTCLAALAIAGAILCVAGVTAMAKQPWFVARVLSTTSVVLGGLALMGYCTTRSQWLRGILLVLVSVASLGYIATDNRIFFDMRRLYQWDVALTNRILARLETLPEFKEGLATIVYVGARPHSAPLPMAVNDMNTSALVASWSQAASFEQSTGYRLQRAPLAREVDLAAATCATSPRWPDQASVQIVDQVAIVCF